MKKKKTVIIVSRLLFMFDDTFVITILSWHASERCHEGIVQG